MHTSLLLCASTLVACADEPKAPAKPSSVALVVAFPEQKYLRPLWFGHVPGTERTHAVVEQRGIVSVFDIADDGKAGARRVLLDIEDRATTRGNEEGLLALAFHPKFAQEGSPHAGRMFAYWCMAERDAKVLCEYEVRRVDGVLACDPASERVLLEVPQPWDNHNGGDLAFGPDGLLYLGIGDGGAADDPRNNAQDVRSLLGKIVRLDVDARPEGKPYGIPADNPYLDVPGARPELWAIGLRNPWRFCFGPDGALWTGDVGQNLYEEVCVVRKGENHGWPFKEGFHDFDMKRKVRGPGAFVAPLVEYKHDEGQSITGGFIYRGAAVEALKGRYVYADYQSGRVWSIAADEKAPGIPRREAELGGIASFGLDWRGELHACSFDGRIHKVVAAP
jgi:glucose/arabinose dehydrogenase